jgi:hypothetical protein
MGKKEFFLQVFQRRIIEVKLSFERAIGNALTASEQVNNLVEQGIKVHRALLLLRVRACPWMMAHHTRTLRQALWRGV